MHFESRKFEDNQFVVKLLPPPRPAPVEMDAIVVGIGLAGEADMRENVAEGDLVPEKAPALA